MNFHFYETFSVYAGIVIVLIGFVYGIYKGVIYDKEDNGIMYVGFIILVPYLNVFALTLMALSYFTNKDFYRGIESQGTLED